MPIIGRKLGAERKAELTQAHSQSLIGYVDEHPTAILTDIRRALYGSIARTVNINIQRCIDTTFRNAS